MEFRVAQLPAMTMKTTFKGGYLRILIALMTIVSSALVLEAGQRWK